MAMTRSDQDSIFGHTYQGVPNPQIPYKHPYPTRYHGPIFTEPRFGTPFEPRPYAVAPYSGVENAQGSTWEVSPKGLLIAAASAGVGWLVLRSLFKSKK